jgi:hypothetical protein
VDIDNLLLVTKCRQAEVPTLDSSPLVNCLNRVRGEGNWCCSSMASPPPFIQLLLILNYSRRFRVENLMETYTLPRNQLHAVIVAYQSLGELKIISTPKASHKSTTNYK